MEWDSAPEYMKYYDDGERRKHPDEVTARDRFECFVRGHDVREWAMFGWCRRCCYSVWGYDRKSVLSYGQYYEYPPKHFIKEGSGESHEHSPVACGPECREDPLKEIKPVTF